MKVQKSKGGNSILPQLWRMGMEIRDVMQQQILAIFCIKRQMVKDTTLPSQIPELSHQVLPDSIELYQLEHVVANAATL